jgi:hypothetical protein
MIPIEIPFRRKRGEMSKRQRQTGQVVIRNGKYIGRCYFDTPDRRVRKAAVLGPKIRDDQA